MAVAEMTENQCKEDEKHGKMVNVPKKSKLLFYI